MKISPADKYFSLCIRERNNWTCEYSGKYFPEGSRQGLHCSHYVGRANYSTRFDPRNAFSHSYHSHAKLGGDPIEFNIWVVDYKGGSLIDYLITQKRDISLGKAIKKSIKQVGFYYKEQYEAMLELRKDGHIGYLEFDGFEP